MAAACNGLSEKMLEEGLGYIKERKAFVKPLSDFQAISFDAAGLIQE